MLICIDYDDTYTKDSLLWNTFIASAKARNHKVICCTMRYEMEGEEVEQTIGKVVDAIYFTCRGSKKGFLNKLNIFPDIWIDDEPSFILYGSDNCQIIGDNINE